VPGKWLRQLLVTEATLVVWPGSAGSEVPPRRRLAGGYPRVVVAGTTCCAVQARVGSRSRPPNPALAWCYRSVVGVEAVLAVAAGPGGVCGQGVRLVGGRPGLGVA